MATAKKTARGRKQDRARVAKGQDYAFLTAEAERPVFLASYKRLAR